jgi:phospholipid-binding lipoprotein MlaA
MIVKKLHLQRRIVHRVLIIGCLLFLPSHVWAGDDPGQADGSTPAVAAQAGDVRSDDSTAEAAWEKEWDVVAEPLADPLEPVNRFFFHFNDKMYYWVLKPVARVYSGIMPDGMEIAVRNIFANLRMPINVVSSLLQGKVRDSSVQVARFALNSTVGIIGLGDFAGDVLNLHAPDEDLGQTFGFYGAGGGFYINWPFLGPSNFRDSIGMIGNAYLHPFFLFDLGWGAAIAGWTVDKVNYTALTLGDYENFTETALDPYTAVKDAYQQYRNGLIEDD